MLSNRDSIKLPFEGNQVPYVKLGVDIKTQLLVL